MRLAIITAAIVALATGAHAADMKTCASQWSAMKKAGTTGSQTYKQFSTTCMAAGSKGVAPAPVTQPADHPKMGMTTGDKSAGISTASSSAAPNGATAQCKDGTFSTSAHHSGSCSRHGGVAKFLK